MEAIMITKKLMIGVAIGALTISGALAQTQSAPPSATPPTATQQSGNSNVVVSQKPDQWLASTFRGTDVMGADNKKIGDVSDILFDKTGKIEAFVVSVGGFLGVGTKDVALAPSSFDVIPGQNGAADKLRLAMSKDQIKQAQNFTPYHAPHATTTGAGNPTGVPGALRPSTRQSPTTGR
jgi:sporulation protein YlmC with PRC-barrel domain